MTVNQENNLRDIFMPRKLYCGIFVYVAVSGLCLELKVSRW